MDPDLRRALIALSDALLLPLEAGGTCKKLQGESDRRHRKVGPMSMPIRLKVEASVVDEKLNEAAVLCSTGRGDLVVLAYTDDRVLRVVVVDASKVEGPLADALDGCASTDDVEDELAGAGVAGFYRGFDAELWNEDPEWGA